MKGLCQNVYVYTLKNDKYSVEVQANHLLNSWLELCQCFRETRSLQRVYRVHPLAVSSREVHVQRSWSILSLVLTSCEC